MKNYYIGNKLLELRGGLSQAEVSSKAGVSRSYYNNVESNRRPASESFLAKIAEYYNVPVSDITNVDEDSSPLAVAISHVTNEHDKVIFSTLSEKWNTQFQEQSECMQNEVNWHLLSLLKDWGYKINSERIKRKESIHVQDENGYLYCDLSHDTIGINLRGNWYSYLDNKDFQNFQKAIESFIHYQLFTYSEIYRQKMKKAGNKDENKSN